MVGRLEAVPAPRHLLAPRPVPAAWPVPELGAPPPGAGPEAPGASDDPPGDPGNGITDEDRNRYGVLLDRALDRGLLTPSDYQVRLAELAEATSIEQMHRIVTELPVFAAPPAKTQGGSRRQVRVPWGERPPGVAASGNPNRSGAPAARSWEQSGRWLVLAALVVVLVASLIVLALLAGHLTHTQSGGLVPRPPSAGAAVLSGLRL